MSTEKREEKVDTLLVRLCEEQTLWIVRESIEINLNEYPELEGMSQDEIQEYIKENASDMTSPSNCDWADSLYDAISQKDVVREKETGYETYVYFE